MSHKSNCCKLHRTSKADSLGLQMHSSYCWTQKNDIPPLTARELASMRRVTPEEHAMLSAAVAEYQEKKRLGETLH